MSIKNILEFCQVAQKDEALNIELENLLSELDSIKASYNDILKTAEKIVRLGEEKDLSFTVSELFNYLENRSRHLTDDELENVTGGIGRKAAGVGLSAIAILSLGTGALSFFNRNETNIVAPERTTVVLRKSDHDKDIEDSDELRERVNENKTYKGGHGNWNDLLKNYSNFRKAPPPDKVSGAIQEGTHEIEFNAKTKARPVDLPKLYSNDKAENASTNATNRQNQRIAQNKSPKSNSDLGDLIGGTRWDGNQQGTIGTHSNVKINRQESSLFTGNNPNSHDGSKKDAPINLKNGYDPQKNSDNLAPSASKEQSKKKDETITFRKKPQRIFAGYDNQDEEENDSISGNSITDNDIENNNTDLNTSIEESFTNEADENYDQQNSESPTEEKIEEEADQIANTCYLTATLWQLYNNSAIKEAILNSTSENEKIVALKELFKSVDDYQFNNEAFLKFINKFQNLYGGEPQDASEIYLKLIDEIEQCGLELKDVKAHVEQQIRLENGADKDVKSTLENEENCINLSIEEVKNKGSLAECFDKNGIFDAVNIEYKSGDDIIPAIKTTKISNSPKTLTINLNRYKYDVESDDEVKASYNNEDELEISEEIIINGNKYRLNAVTVYFGSAVQGHYVSYVRNQDCWKSIDNENVQEVDFDDITEEISKNATMVTYENVDKKK